MKISILTIGMPLKQLMTLGCYGNSKASSHQQDKIERALLSKNILAR